MSQEDEVDWISFTFDLSNDGQQQQNQQLETSEQPPRRRRASATTTSASSGPNPSYRRPRPHSAYTYHSSAGIGPGASQNFSSEAHQQDTRSSSATGDVILNSSAITRGRSNTTNCSANRSDSDRHTTMDSAQDSAPATSHRGEDESRHSHSYSIKQETSPLPASKSTTAPRPQTEEPWNQGQQWAYTKMERAPRPPPISVHAASPKYQYPPYSPSQVVSPVYPGGYSPIVSQYNSQPQSPNYFYPPPPGHPHPSTQGPISPYGHARPMSPNVRHYYTQDHSESAMQQSYYPEHQMSYGPQHSPAQRYPQAHLNQQYQYQHGQSGDHSQYPSHRSSHYGYSYSPEQQQQPRHYQQHTQHFTSSQRGQHEQPQLVVRHISNASSLVSMRQEDQVSSHQAPRHPHGPPSTSSSSASSSSSTMYQQSSSASGSAEPGLPHVYGAAYPSHPQPQYCPTPYKNTNSAARLPSRTSSTSSSSSNRSSSSSSVSGITHNAATAISSRQGGHIRAQSSQMLHAQSKRKDFDETSGYALSHRTPTRMSPSLPPVPMPTDMGDEDDAAAAAVKQIKRRRKTDSDADYSKGRWKTEELNMLLHISRVFIRQELRVICDAAMFCGIQRPHRAIDKQLKRLLQYERWAKRDQQQVAQTISNLIGGGAYGLLTEDQNRALEAAAQIWSTSPASGEGPS